MFTIIKLMPGIGSARQGNKRERKEYKELRGRGGGVGGISMYMTLAITSDIHILIGSVFFPYDP